MIKMKKNPEVKKGDKIILIKGNNSNSKYVGKVLDVKKGGRVINAFCKELNLSCDVFNDKPTDVYRLCDREEQATFLDTEIKRLRIEIKEIEVEAKRLRMFKSDEAEVANKIHKLVKAKGEKDILAILKELKKSDYL